MRFDSTKAVDLLINNIAKFPVHTLTLFVHWSSLIFVFLVVINLFFLFQISSVVQQLKPEPKLLLIYLHNLFNQKRETVQYDPAFHDLQIELYAEYDPNNLRDFLEKVRSSRD